MKPFETTGWGENTYSQRVESSKWRATLSRWLSILHICQRVLQVLLKTFAMCSKALDLSPNRFHRLILTNGWSTEIVESFNASRIRFLVANDDDCRKNTSIDRISCWIFWLIRLFFSPPSIDLQHSANACSQTSPDAFTRRQSLTCHIDHFFSTEEIDQFVCFSDQMSRTQTTYLIIKSSFLRVNLTFGQLHQMRISIFSMSLWARLRDQWNASKLCSVCHQSKGKLKDLSVWPISLRLRRDQVAINRSYHQILWHFSGLLRIGLPLMIVRTMSKNSSCD